MSDTVGGCSETSAVHDFCWDAEIASRAPFVRATGSEGHISIYVSNELALAPCPPC